MYTKNSKYPSVTEILSPYSDYSHIPPAVLAKAAERGTLVHSYCEAISKSEWMPNPREDLAGYVQSFQRWFNMFVDEVIMSEEELEDSDLGYCGHPDLIVRSKSLGGIILIDIKTPAIVYRTWGPQIAAYERLARQDYPSINRMGSLRLDKAGKMAKFDDFTGDKISCFAAFYGALIAYKFFAK